MVVAPAPTKVPPPIGEPGGNYGCVRERRLTPREREVLELVLQRWHDKEIAEYLVVSVRTVETHVAHIFQKLGVHSRDQLTDLAEDQ